MYRFIIRRLLSAVPLIIAITMVSFAIMQLAPGDFLTQMSLNPQISPQLIEKLRVTYGLDQPMHIRYLRWLWGVIHLDFGYSFAYHMPVAKLIAQRAAATLLLGLSSTIFAWGIAVPLGILAAVHRNSWIDRLTSVLAFMGISIPTAFLALLAVYATSRTGWLPIGGMHHMSYEFMTPWQQFIDLLRHLILPTLVLGIGMLAGLMRQVRSNLLETLRSDYVTTARAKGVPERLAVYRHAFGNAINPLITIFGYYIGDLLSGAALVEIVMAWPGLGRLMLDALAGKDIYLVMGSLVISSIMLIGGNLLADILLAYSDPRIRYD
ncbi:MAG: ABC transporter permease [bacterium]|nr:ABC transporter permease [bacterium]